MKKNRIIAVHLLNDFSGSPFVLRQVLEALVQKNFRVELFTATPSEQGFLSNITGVNTHRIFYRWHKNRWYTLFFFLYSQLSLFVKLLFHLQKTDTVYINSLLPFGGALAAKLRGCPVIYHIHEVSVKPQLLKKFLITVANFTAARGIFVSEDVRNRTPFTKPAQVVYNALPQLFIQEAIQHVQKKEGPFTVLMVCSLKKYKGVFEFAGCAEKLPAYRFLLVLNAPQAEIDDFFSGTKLPGNLELFPAQKNVHPFYQQADVVMNLSLPKQWIETFGMTALEAMYYKKPVIVPDAGGITELVTDQQEGYRVNPHDIQEVCDQLQLMATCASVYNRLSVNAFKKAQQFTPRAFASGITELVSQVLYKKKKQQPETRQLSFFTVGKSFR